MTTGMPATGDVAAVPLPDGGYGACQVAGAGRDGLIVYALAWYSADRPGLDRLAEAPPLVLDHHVHRNEPARIAITGGELPPPDWEWLGRLPVPPAMSGPVSSYAGWAWARIQLAAQRRWDRQLPDAVKRAYRRAATRGQVEVDLGGGPVVLGAATAWLDLTGAGPLTPPATGPVRWSALDDLPRCTSVTWAGADRGLVDALGERPIVSNLTWTDAPSDLDLRGTRLTRLSIGGTVDTVRLPDGLLSLDLIDGASIGSVTAAGEGERLRLSVTGPAPDARVPAGLSRLRDLLQIGGGTISAAPLSALRHLEVLRLGWRGAPGDLHDAAVLADLPRLTRLTLNDAYGLDVDTLPDLPALTGLTIHGLRRSAATAIRARHRRGPVHLLVSGAKNDTWLAANLTNPLRDWADDDPRGGAAACKAYAAAVRAVDALPADAPDRAAAAEPVLRSFIERLNRVEKRYGLIDTLRRDEAGDAFLGLAERAGVATEVADGWFDEWRYF